MNATWSERARKFGRRCVYDLSVPEEQFDDVTVFQERELFPLLKAALSSRPQRILDFGCGAGRFTASIRRFTQADYALGFDPCPELIEMAILGTSDERTDFHTGTSRDFFSAMTIEFDLIWIATVLGGLDDRELAIVADNLTSALTQGGVLFFAENTAPDNPENPFWRNRPVSWYEEAFGQRGVLTRRVGSYFSCGNEVSAFAGKKCTNA